MPVTIVDDIRAAREHRRRPTADGRPSAYLSAEASEPHTNDRCPHAVKSTVDDHQEIPPVRVPVDATDDKSRAIERTMPAGRYVDALPLLVLATASLRTAAAL